MAALPLLEVVTFRDRFGLLICVFRSLRPLAAALNRPPRMSPASPDTIFTLSSRLSKQVAIPNIAYARIIRPELPRAREKWRFGGAAGDGGLIPDISPCSPRRRAGGDMIQIRSAAKHLGSRTQTLKGGITPLRAVLSDLCGKRLGLSASPTSCQNRCYSQATAPVTPCDT